MRFIRTNALELVFIGLLGFLFSGVAHAQVEAISQDDPEKMVLLVSNKVISELNANRELFESSSAEVRAFALNHVLPYIDTEKMARYVMGKYWRVASNEQKKGFVEAFTDTMIRSYSQSLLKLRIESVEVEKAREEKPGRVTVASKVAQSDGNKSDIIYRVYFNKSTNKWMLYDVAVEGISMLLSYRKAYGSDISKKGLDAVIAEMQEKNSAFNSQATL